MDFSNSALRSILNKVMKDSPVAKIWAIKGFSNNQRFFIRLTAGQEDNAAIAEHPDVPQVSLQSKVLRQRVVLPSRRLMLPFSAQSATDYRFVWW